MVKILIVEDEENIARMIQANIDLTDYESEIVDNGPDAVKKILEGDYDLVLLDVMLPGFDGFEVMRRIEGRAFLSFFSPLCRMFPIRLRACNSERKTISSSRSRVLSFWQE